MRIDWIHSTGIPLICKDNPNNKFGPEKPGEVYKVYLQDLEDFKNRDQGCIRSMKYFVDNIFDKSHSQYSFLKELIYSEDRDNLIIALTIINEI